MRGGAVALAERAARLEDEFDVLFASDMVSLAELAALLPASLRALPRALYFHENQLTYPARFESERDYQFGFTNITSALAAEHVVFNSDFHRREFLGALPAFLRRMPDCEPPPGEIARRIEAKSVVVHPGIDVEDIPAPDRAGRDGPLAILWNHRWEFDKQPEAFFAALEKLAVRGADFRVLVCGESFREVPEVFARARAALGARAEHFGFVASRAAYLVLLARADIVVSTAAHEFFGIAVLEACAAGCMPLLPARLSYPELVPEALHARCVYEKDSDLVARLAELAADPAAARGESRQWREIAERFAWPGQAAKMDALLEEVTNSPA